nr:MAG TPA: hypothetical protein [Caudoviricetes sp.]
MAKSGRGEISALQLQTIYIRIMSTLRIKCLDMCEVESIIADAQEILSHVEFGSLKNGVLTLFCVA